MNYAECTYGPIPGASATKVLLVAALSTVGFLLPAAPARAQGCIVAHSTVQIGGPESQGGYLPAKHWQLEIDYRHQYSFRHFVGDVEQSYRIQQGTQVENRVNLQNIQLTYQFTPR